MSKPIGGVLAAVWGSAIIVASGYAFFTDALNLKTEYGAVALVGTLFGVLLLGVGVYEVAQARRSSRQRQ